MVDFELKALEHDVVGVGVSLPQGDTDRGTEVKTRKPKDGGKVVKDKGKGKGRDDIRAQNKDKDVCKDCGGDCGGVDCGKRRKRDAVDDFGSGDSDVEIVDDFGRQKFVARGYVSLQQLV
jgi:hypothetical protein